MIATELKSFQPSTSESIGAWWLGRKLSHQVGKMVDAFAPNADSSQYQTIYKKDAPIAGTSVDRIMVRRSFQESNDPLPVIGEVLDLKIGFYLTGFEPVLQFSKIDVEAFEKKTSYHFTGFSEETGIGLTPSAKEVLMDQALTALNGINAEANTKVYNQSRKKIESLLGEFAAAQFQGNEDWSEEMITPDLKAIAMIDDDGVKVFKLEYSPIGEEKGQKLEIFFYPEGRKLHFGYIRQKGQKESFGSLAEKTRILTEVNQLVEIGFDHKARALDGD